MAVAECAVQAERYRRVKELFVAARDFAGAQRAEFLERECGGDGELRAEVESLLASDAQASGFLSQSLSAPSGDERPAPLPERIASFRIVRMLGYGGMGVVYLAEQANPRREVALKVLRSDLALLGGRKRFELEAQVLARLRHPGIAQVFDAGLADTEVGERPWFAMEYVRGRPLLEHAVAAGLDHRARLELCIAVCDAVQAAHEQGVVHRDLKPANILVDEAGRPKILDFGMARVLGSDASTLHTLTGQIVGTLAYMSPEQASGAPSLADPRSDVYSLGVVLYELLTGRLPYDTRGKLIHEAVRAIREDDPTPISRILPRLAGDVETIVGKALEKEPQRRYARAADLAEDLRRHLRSEPIRARPPTALYQVSRFAQRNRGLAAGAAAAFLALAAGLVAALYALDRAHAAERRTSDERDAVLRLRDLQKLGELQARARALWPVAPALVPELEAWLAEARGLGARLAMHREFLAALRAPAAGADAQFSGVERADTRWLAERQADLIAGLEEFLRDSGAPVSLGDTSLPAIERRLALARSFAERIEGADRDAWRRAIAAVADPAGPYGGLALAPQPGLAPLGADPSSGLWEFALLDLTGPAPARDPETGELAQPEDAGVVLVLLPGGRFLSGAQATDPAQPNYDPWSDAHEGPVRAIELAPWLVSKYELTQAQWLRFTGGNRSGFKIGELRDDRTVTGRHPVEMVSWDEACDVLAALGLALPTDAQWEYAARGGTHTVWSTGDSLASLDGAANTAYPTEFLRDPAGERSDWGDDAWGLTAPVGSFPPNPFGLYDVHGNVWEWCLDTFKVLGLSGPVRDGDGLRLVEVDAMRSMRGGSFFESPFTARIAYRNCQVREARNAVIGVRPARALR